MCIQFVKGVSLTEGWPCMPVENKCVHHTFGFSTPGSASSSRTVPSFVQLHRRRTPCHRSAWLSCPPAWWAAISGTSSSSSQGLWGGGGRGGGGGLSLCRFEWLWSLCWACTAIMYVKRSKKNQKHFSFVYYDYSELWVKNAPDGIVCTTTSLICFLTFLSSLLCTKAEPAFSLFKRWGGSSSLQAMQMLLQHQHSYPHFAKHCNTNYSFMCIFTFFVKSLVLPFIVWWIPGGMLFRKGTQCCCCVVSMTSGLWAESETRKASSPRTLSTSSILCMMR